MENRIIISISDLDKSNWGLIYQFIKRSYDNSSIDNETFNELKKINATLKISYKYLDKDVYSEYGNDLQFETQVNTEKTTFAILYKKLYTSRDFTNIVPFYLLHKEFQGKITLGINVDCFSDVTQLSDFTFPCRTLLQIFKNTKPINGQNTVYFINEKYIDRETGEIITFRTSTATFRNQDDKNMSRYILPLTVIEKDLYYSLFKSNNLNNKIVNDFKIAISNQNRIFYETDQRLNGLSFRSIFEEWFVKAYFVSLKKPSAGKVRFDDDKNNRNKESYIKENDFRDLTNLLKTYCENIKELIENIIFHTTEKQGLIYITFREKRTMPAIQYNSILNVGSYVDAARFVEIGIMDFNEKGILDTYKLNNEDTAKTQLLDFFDTQKIHTTGLDHLYLRYIAHLGIKTFANAVKNHSGSFYVESNNQGKKEVVKYYTCQLPEEIQTLPYFCNGTHYEIIFPVTQRNRYNYSNDNSKTIIQYKSISSYLEKFIQKELPVFTNINFNKILKERDYLTSINISSKEEQNKLIITIGNLIIQNHLTDKNTIVFNVKPSDNPADISPLFNLFISDTGLFFKLLAYIQLRKDSSFKRIILTHLPNSFIDNFCDKINKLLINSGVEPIWSNDTAIILISNNLRYQIICGETKDEIAYINDKINSYYFNRNSFDVAYNSDKITPTTILKLDDFILPYEFLIKTNNVIDFKQYVSDILENPIETENIGCKVSHKNSRIGNKIIIENYYEADFLFQNSFFVDRFAYFTAKEIINLRYDNQAEEDKIALIGYNPYSELLIKKIQFYVNNYYKKNKIVTVIIAKEEDNELIFKFDSIHKKDFEKKIECEILPTYKYITIVPIASTLTTNDKIIALFTQKTGSQKDNFIYNHCTILVRDRINDKITENEALQKWTSKTGSIIGTNFDNSKEINFLIEKEGVWHSLLNNDISFPTNYRQEIPVNQTQNASLNSQNLFSYPNVAIPKEHQNDRDNFYKLTQKRLFELKDYIYFGHIESNKNHHRYYIDTEEFVRSGNRSLKTWIKELKQESVYKENTSHILITPDTNIESDFINLINEELFSNSALVLYIDIDKWRNNIKDKFSFLQAINVNDIKPKFHFIDHALLTASSYKKAKSYILSILSGNHQESITFKFDSVITLINRLSHDGNKEISEAEDTKIYSFTHLFIPPSKDPEKDCTLCELNNHYNKLRERSVLDGCRAVIDKNKKKIAAKPFNRYTYNNDTDLDIKINKITDKNRYLVRLQLKHRLFFEISNIVNEYNGNIQTETEIKTTNRLILRKLTQIYNECSGDIDAKISFLKNISSPPLSHYIKLRYYAHRKLLIELHKILTTHHQNKEPDFNDLRLLKVLLKQLSMLGSNALVRKDVIIGTWKLYFSIKKQISQEIKPVYKSIAKKRTKLHKLNSKDTVEKVEKSDIFSQGQQKQIQIEKLQDEIKQLKQKYTDLDDKKNKCKDFNFEFQFFIKNVIFDDEAKSLYLGELLRTGYEIKQEDIENNTIKINKTILDNSIYANFKDETKKNRNDYLRFLLWTFYDNTTIIRRTLENFEKELYKYSTLKDLFFIKKDQLQDFEYLCKNIYAIKSIYQDKISKQYYYSSIYKYTNQNAFETGNPDEIDFIEKLIYVLYAKLYLKEINKKIKRDINEKRLEDITQTLLQVFEKIMGANAAFFSIKHENEKTKDSTIHTLSADNLKTNINYNEQYYTTDLFEGRAFNHNVMFPLLIKETLDNYQEKKELGYNNLACLVINNPQNSITKDLTDNRPNIIGSVTFLYNTKDTAFKVKTQEYGRLLLLLKPEFDEYITHILSEKTVDLWLEKQEIDKLNKDFKTRYYKNSHGAKQCLEEVSSLLFDKCLVGDPYIYAMAADLYVGNIHYALLIEERIKFNTNIYSIIDKKRELIPVIQCARRHLVKECFSKKNIFIKYSDFINKKIYYSDETPFLLFQIIRNIVKHTKSPHSEAEVFIYTDEEYIVFKNTNPEITQEKLNAIKHFLNDEIPPRESISLYCINHYVQNMCNNKLRKKKLVIELDNKENAFIIKIPIIKF